MVETLWTVLQASLLVLALAFVWLFIVSFVAQSIKAIRHHKQAEDYATAKQRFKAVSERARERLYREN